MQVKATGCVLPLRCKEFRFCLQESEDERWGLDLWKPQFFNVGCWTAGSPNPLQCVVLWSSSRSLLKDPRQSQGLGPASTGRRLGLGTVILPRTSGFRLAQDLRHQISGPCKMVPVTVVLAAWYPNTLFPGDNPRLGGVQGQPEGGHVPPLSQAEAQT